MHAVSHTRYGDIVQYASLSFPMEDKPNPSCNKLLTKENLTNRCRAIRRFYSDHIIPDKMCTTRHGAANMGIQFV